MSGLGGWLHLARRFFEVLFAQPLTPSEQEEVRSLCRAEEESALFFSQPSADQQHGLAAARHAPVPLRRAALFHDVGKQVSGLGVFGRSLASAAAKLHIRVGGRYARYLQHGPIGAGLLEEAGLEDIVVDYARHHHADRPQSIPDRDWVALIDADRKARPNSAPPIR